MSDTGRPVAGQKELTSATWSRIGVMNRVSHAHQVDELAAADGVTMGGLGQGEAPKADEAAVVTEE